MAEPPRLRVDPDERLRPAASRGRPRQAPRRVQRRKPPGRGLLGRAVKLGVLLGLWAVIIGGGALAYFAFTLPDTSQLTVADRRPSVTILAEDGNLIASFGDLFGRPLTLKEMSPFLPKAVIATEDRRFYHHFGIDPVGLARAALTDLRAGQIVQGGSTITQQLAKVLFLSPERNIAARSAKRCWRCGWSTASRRTSSSKSTSTGSISAPGPMASTRRPIAISANRPPSSTCSKARWWPGC